MTDLRSEETIDARLTSKATDGLASYIVGMVERWEQRRDQGNQQNGAGYLGNGTLARSGNLRKWEEFRRLWMGEWAPQDRDRNTERSHAIMPAIQQAVDSAVSEVEEAIFGQERWFDVESDNPSTPTDEGGPGRQLADQLLRDLEPVKAAVSEIALLGAVYGTGIGKIVIHEAGPDSIAVELVAIEPREFVIDPGANTIDEAEGVAHVFHLPYNVVLERQRQGIYDAVDPRIGVEPGDERHVDAMVVRIIEYQGLVPANMLPDVDDDRKKLSFEDEKPVEAIVTIANGNVVLRAVQNPLNDRGFVAFQWDTVPNQFWGRGIVEKGYWPQKVLDSEVRARIDALGFATVPMMAINSAAVPRGADFAVRPGRNVFLNGPPGENIETLRFPPPDPQTYTQGQEMQRMIEMATGQLQAATPFGTNGRNETASGMSMMLGASIRRTRRTMANINRAFMKPFLAKAIRRFNEFDQRYQVPFRVEVKGTLGMMAREFESMQIGQLLNAMPPGPAQFMLLRAVVDNMGLSARQDILNLLDILTAQALEPQEPPPDLAGQARVMSVQVRQQEVAADAQNKEHELMLEQNKLEVQAQSQRRNHEIQLMRLAVEAERAESDDVAKTSKAILDLAKAEAEELGQQLGQYKQAVEEIANKPAVEPSIGADIDVSGLREMLEEIRDRIGQEQGLNGEDIAPVTIERDGQGLVTSVNGRSVTRDQNGLLVGLQ